MINETNTAVAEIHENTDFMMGLDELKRRANMVSDIKKQIMRKDTHFGVVPGCGNKPTLLKNGAELLCMAFKLAPDAKVEIADLGNGHREYTVTTTLTSIVTGVPVATGLGSCSTMESKYRYRGTELVNTGKSVPSAYWADKDPSKLGGRGFVAKKDENGKWMIFQKGDKKMENPDVADVYNTVLKMASKRSLVDATLKATGGSCEFTQDIEDMGPQASDAEFTDYQVMDEPQQQPAPARNPAPKKGTDDEQKAKFVSMMGVLEQKAPEAYAQALKGMNIADLDKVQPNMRQIVYKSAQQAVTAAEANEQFDNKEAKNG